MKPLLPNVDLRPLKVEEVERRIDRLRRHFERPKWLRPPLSAPRISRLVRALARARHKIYDVRREAPPLLFLDGMADLSFEPPKHEYVEELLRRAETAERNDLRLLYLWFAIRGLMSAPYADRKFENLADLWSRALGAWARASAWYGLHGHLKVGCLAALATASKIRLEVGTLGGVLHGPLASEYYSQARLAVRSKGLLDLARRHIDAALEIGEGERSGQLAIRGSILRRTGDHAAAIADYKMVVDLRRPEGGTGLGEALSELGFAQMLSGSTGPGVVAMEEGLLLLQQSAEIGFQIRAARKLALGYARQLRLRPALSLASTAYQAAVDHQAYDQIGPLERLAHRLDRRRSSRD